MDEREWLARIENDASSARLQAQALTMARALQATLSSKPTASVWDTAWVLALLAGGMGVGAAIFAAGMMYGRLVGS
jgi:hypothetical protein